MELTLNTIPTLLVAFVMLYTGLIWLLTRKLEIRMDSKIIGYTLLLQGVSYLMNSIYESDITLMERIVSLRFILIIVCLSQAIPLTVSYIRALRRYGGI